MAKAVPARSLFQLVLIKPTHYDDDGYPITWLRSHIPSNTLAALYGLAGDCQHRKILGPDVDLLIRPIDETNTRVRVDRLVADIRRSGGRALICLVGVQTNQFPRAVEIGRQFVEAGFPVALGGFHVSGCLSMLPVLPDEIKAAMDLGISMFTGEAEEGRLDVVIRDAWNGTMKPLYNHMDDLPNWKARRSRACRRRPSCATTAACRASISAVAARSNALSAPSSTCRAAKAGFAAPTTSKKSCGRTSSRASRHSSSPTTTWRAIVVGRSSSIA
jgi:hypothetical protein